MIDDILSERRATGALVTSPHSTSTALASPDALRPQRDLSARDGVIQQLVETTLDSLDSLGDAIAGVIGLR